MTWMETTAAPRSRGAAQGALRALWSARSWRTTLHALLGLPLGVAGWVVIAGLGVGWAAALWSLIEGPTGGPAARRGLRAGGGRRPGRGAVVRAGLQRPAAAAVPGRSRGRAPGAAAPGPGWLAAAAAPALGRIRHLAAARLPPAGPGDRRRRRCPGGGLLAGPAHRGRLRRRPLGRRWPGGRRAGLRRPGGRGDAGRALGGARRGRRGRGRGPGPARPRPGRRADPAGRVTGPEPGRDRRRHRRRTAPDRARPPRRRPAAAGLAGHEPGDGPRQPHRRGRARPGGHRQGARRGRGRPRRAARVRPWPAPGRAQRPRAGRGAARDRRPGAAAGPAARRHGVALLAQHRGRRLLRRVRGAHQRGQARQGQPRRGHRGRRGDRLLVVVSDDGQGGAAPAAGSGLDGLAQRAAAVDGTLAIDSPPGGPTTITVELPCES